MADLRRLVERVWWGRSAVDAALRLMLGPAAGLFGAATRLRNRLYDRGVLHSRALALPALSVGNLTVGGTGKTPVAAWLAGELAKRGRRPAIVLRGYGADEQAVHAVLTPAAVVVVNADRVAGVARAASLGADAAVLDDAFQHRRARRDGDIVLVSADRWASRVRTLPAGPFREGLQALRRASLVLVTRKAASIAEAERVARVLGEAAPGVPIGRIHLAATALVDARTGASRALGTLAGRDVLAVCGIGDPAAFAAQLTAAGARVTLRAFPDHHAFTSSDIAALVDALAAAEGGMQAVCTLKDAVKLASRWPAGAPDLSYVSQQVILEVGREALDRLLDRMLPAPGPAAAAAG